MKGKSNPVGPGKVRKTFYMGKKCVDDLEAGIDRHLARIDHRVARAVVHAEIIKAGLEREEAVATRLRQRLEQDI